ncbi:MAG: hypothetical protein ACFB4J_09585 [Elainellaceae cyanobacterium]
MLRARGARFVVTFGILLAAAPARPLLASPEVQNLNAQNLDTQNLNEFQLQVDHQLNDAQAVLEQEGYVQVKRYVDTRGLGETESHQWDLQLDVGHSYVVTAVCDSDCADLDLVWYESGSEVVRDTESDAYPILTVSPSVGAQQMEVTMYGCEVEPCYYGFGVFRR